MRAIGRLSGKLAWGVVFISVLSTAPLLSQDQSGHRYPRLANYYLLGQIDARDVDYLAGWDISVFSMELDRSSAYRQNLAAIREANPDAIMLLYHISTAVNTSLNPPEPLHTAADAYGWWLRDFEGNILTDAPPWSFNHLINFADTEEAGGTHPTGQTPGEFLAADLYSSHLQPYDHWDGIFYDVFSDNLRFLYENIKDATCNAIPEFDDDENGEEPMFDSIWRSGMINLARDTYELSPESIIVGNGLHRTATQYLNGRMQEKYRRSSDNLSSLASMYNYLVTTERDRPIVILDGAIDGFNYYDFASTRFSLVSSLLTDAYYSTYGTVVGRNQVLWFDEYTVKPDGEVGAITATLTQSVSESQDTIPVESTAGFPEKGVISIEAEQIYYNSKTDKSFKDCIRGYPHVEEARFPHTAATTVAHYLKEYKGYLGYPLNDTFDIYAPSIKLKDLYAEAGWFATEQRAVDIDSRVWRRDFQHGIAILNPTPEAVVVNGMGSGVYKKIKGIQDPVHNDGRTVQDSLTIGPKDGFILLSVAVQDLEAPSPPSGLEIIE